MTKDGSESASKCLLEAMCKEIRLNYEQNMVVSVLLEEGAWGHKNGTSGIGSLVPEWY